MPEPIPDTDLNSTGYANTAVMRCLRRTIDKLAARSKNEPLMLEAVRCLEQAQLEVAVAYRGTPAMAMMRQGAIAAKLQIQLDNANARIVQLNKRITELHEEKSKKVK